MFGYVKPAYPELKVREHELYRAYYCGLCRALGKCTGQLSRFTLSYDPVFLAMLRHAVLGESCGVRMRRCAVHPLKKRPSVESTPTMEYCAAVCAALFGAKLSDDRSDERGVRCLLAAAATPYGKSMLRRASRYSPELVTAVRKDLSVLSALEEAKSPDIDSAADAFGTLLGHIMCAGIDSDGGRVLFAVGKHTGRLIYVIDAADDAARDHRNDSYNPILLSYGENALEKREVWDLRGNSSEKVVLRRHIAEGLYSAAQRTVFDLCAAVELLDFSAVPEVEGIVKNICAIGLPGELRRALGLTVGPTPAAHRENTPNSTKMEGTKSYD